MSLYCYLNNFDSGWSLFLNFTLCNLLSLDRIPHLPIAKTNGTSESVVLLEESGGKRGWREEPFKHARSLLTRYYSSWQAKTHLPIYLQDTKSPYLNLFNLHGARCWEIQDFNVGSGKDYGRLVNGSLELQNWSHGEVPNPEPDARP